MSLIYLDHNSTSPVSPEIWKEMQAAPWGNPNTPSKYGVEARMAMNKAERIIKEHINGHDGYIIWTSSGSMANYLAITGTCEYSGDLITSCIEHRSIYDLYRRFGYTLPCLRSGIVDLSYGSQRTGWRLLSSKAKIVSIMYVNNETGVIQPISLVKARSYSGSWFHVDAVQALGKIRIDVDADHIDMLTLSAHKIGGPKGVGCLWLRNNVHIRQPYLGTPNVAGIVGFGKAVAMLDVDKRTSKVEKSDQCFLETLINTGVECSLNSIAPRTPGTLSLRFPGVDGDELMLTLGTRGVVVSQGSACNSKETNPSHVLLNMGVSEQGIKSTIRISMGEDLDIGTAIDAANIIAKTVKELSNGS
jgi:cysteine desulfurase